MTEKLTSPEAHEELKRLGDKVLRQGHFDRADMTKTANRLIRRLQQIGYKVEAVPACA